VTTVNTDPITREIVNNALLSIADTMAMTVVRTARSAVVKDGMDFSTALFTADGQQVAQGLTLPAHLGSMAPVLEGIKRRFGNDINPEDIFACNDPYEGGSHLPDIFVFKPIFIDNEVIAWTCAIGHQTDIGGRVAGGVVCDNTEIYQEGLLIPPTKLYDAGKLNEAVWWILEKNVRLPEKVLGDVRALLSAVRLGERDFRALVADYGKETITAYMYEILDTTERLARASVAKLPQGEWEFTDYVDHDGIDFRPIAIKVKVRLKGDTVHMDFTGTSPQSKGSINPNLHYTRSQCFATIKCLLDAQIQSNSGFFRIFDIFAPEGSFVNPLHPAPLAARGLSGFRICHAIFGALAQAMPERIPAAWGGGEVGLSFTGYTPQRKAWVHLDLINDGPGGGGPHLDGADGLSSPVNNMSIIPVEVAEAEHPIIVQKYELVPDTEGAGKYRGGLAIRRQYQVLVDDTVFQLRSDRTEFAAWGVQGGLPGVMTESRLNPDGENRKLIGKTLMTLKKNDIFRITQASGGGYGDPFDRDPDAVLRDVIEEKMTAARVKDVYGVVIDVAKRVVDHDATDSLRKAKRGQGLRPAHSHQ
jgi:N-methylhydantoinase B